MSEPPNTAGATQALQRRLGVFDAVVIGLGSMIGAGIFAALAPAAHAGGSGLLLGLALAAVVAYCNATSSGRLAPSTRHPAAPTSTAANAWATSGATSPAGRSSWARLPRVQRWR